MGALRLVAQREIDGFLPETPPSTVKRLEGVGRDRGRDDLCRANWRCNDLWSRSTAMLARGILRPRKVCATLLAWSPFGELSTSSVRFTSTLPDVYHRTRLKACTFLASRPQREVKNIAAHRV